MADDKRIADLEAELAEARATIDRLRGLESENRELKERVHDLHEELVSLSPPKLPKFSRAAGDAGGGAAGKSRLMTWTTLVLVLLGAFLASLPYLLSQIDSNNRDAAQFSDERGIRAPE